MTWWILAAILSQPTPELGTIRWERSWDNAVARARGEHKPILVLFDEIPGCSTVLAFGRTVLSAPDVVATVETYFVPLAVYNNTTAGPDRALLEAFAEPAWNNPVVRLVDADRRALAPRFAGPYTKEAFTRVLEKAVPRGPLLRLSGPCFWACEAKLGALDAVRASRVGFLDGREVVEVELRPGTELASFVEVARKLGCAGQVFDEAAAGRFEPSPKDTKYHLARSPYKDAALDPTTQCRVNAAIARGEDPAPLLSSGK